MRERAFEIELAEADLDGAMDQELGQDPSQRQDGGAIPPVLPDATGVARPRSPSEEAYDGAESKDERELKTKVAALVTTKFDGDYKKAFDHYDSNNDGGVEKGEIVQLLEDAGVGNGFTRGAWARAIIKKVDRSGDKKIQWAEFDKVFNGP